MSSQQSDTSACDTDDAYVVILLKLNPPNGPECSWQYLLGWLEVVQQPGNKAIPATRRSRMRRAGASPLAGKSLALLAGPRSCTQEEPE